MPTYTTSGTTNWTMTETQIIHRAGRIVGAIGSSDQMNANEYSDARLVLNSVISSLINSGCSLWKREWITQSFNPLSTVVGSDGSNYYAIKPHTSTEDDKPVTGENFQEFWSNGESTLSQWISGASYTSSNQFTLSNDIVDIDKMFVRDTNLDSVVTKISLDDFFELSSKTNFTTSTPTHFAVEQKLTNSIVHLYPVPIVESDIKLHLLVTKRFFENDTTGENTDFPVEALEMLVYLLAERLADEYHLDLSERSWIASKAEKLKNAFTGKLSRDMTSSFVSPCFRS
jgi:hypothetical protein